MAKVGAVKAAAGTSAVLAAGRKQFEEAKHPRGRGGKFASKGGRAKAESTPAAGAPGGTPAAGTGTAAAVADELSARAGSMPPDKALLAGELASRLRAGSPAAKPAAPAVGADLSKLSDAELETAADAHARAAADGIRAGTAAGEAAHAEHVAEIERIGAEQKRRAAPEPKPEPKPAGEPAAKTTGEVPAGPAAGFTEAARVDSPVSGEFAAGVRAGLSAVPDAVRRRMAAAGVNVRMAAALTDSRPDLAGRQPYGYAPGQTYDAVAGLCDGKGVYVAERALGSREASGAALHEYGHAVDLNWHRGLGGVAGVFARALGGGGRGNLSRSAAFRAAYAADVAGLGPADHLELSYYTQPGHVGPQEAFAESFAAAHGSGGGMGDRGRIERAFPRCIAFVKATLAKA